MAEKLKGGRRTKLGSANGLISSRRKRGRRALRKTSSGRISGETLSKIVGFALAGNRLDLMGSGSDEAHPVRRGCPFPLLGGRILFPLKENLVQITGGGGRNVAMLLGKEGY